MVSHPIPNATTASQMLANADGISQPDQVWDCQQAALFLRIHPATVKRLARRGRLPGFRSRQPVALPVFRPRRLGALCGNLTTLFAPRIEEDSFAAKHVSVRLD